MKKHIAFGFFVLIFTSVSVWAAQHVQVEPLAGELTKAKAGISKAKKLPEKLKLLSDLKASLDDQFKHADRAEVAKKEDFYYSLTALRRYLKSVPTEGFSLKSCSKYRNAVIVGFAPQSENEPPSEVPAEAQETLDLIALLCGKPSLAQIRTK